MEAILPNHPPTPDDVVRMHADLIARYGGDGTTRASDRDCADRSLGAALQGAFYLAEDGRIDPLHHAACLLVYLAKNHCFTDGNKRVAWYAAVDYLLSEGWLVVADQGEAAQLVLDVAASHCDRDGVIRWLARDGVLCAYVPPHPASPPAP